MAEHITELAWLIGTEKGSFVMVARDSWHALRLAQIVARQDYGEITLIERIAGDGVFIGEGVDGYDHPDIGPEVLKLFTVLP